MPEYTLECTGDCREVYHVTADSEDEARDMFLNGDVPDPSVTECSTSIDNIWEEDA